MLYEESKEVLLASAGNDPGYVSRVLPISLPEAVFRYTVPQANTLAHPEAT